ncbi:MAG: NAD-dependent epimerase/dehydratase family protein [Chloroflexi bacterium]|nr:NAD-dependent epimerase/dehydratase family protein [Chloroflexota bacterium]
MGKNKQVLITGATGFIGGHLARYLVNEGKTKVRVLARNPEKGKWLSDIGVEVVIGDITEIQTLKDVTSDCNIIFHAAARVGESGSKQVVREVNVKGTQNIVEDALSTGVDRFVYISSCAVYGSLQAFNISEDTPTRITGKLYHDSKVAAEKIVFRSHHEFGLPVVVARASQVYGPGSKQFTIRPIEAIKSGKMILIDGGRHLCKPVYIDNLIDGLILCARVNTAIGEAFNLTDGCTLPWRDFFGAYAQMLEIQSLPSLPYQLAWFAALLFEIKSALEGKKSSITRGAVNSLRSSNSFSNQKAREMLGWQPIVNLEEGMKYTEAWLREKGFLEKI